MRYQIAETPTILGKFNTGDTVTITLYDLSDESSETLTSNACNELGSTGVFYWSTSNITTQPTAFIEYCWVMTNGTSSQYGKIVLGGYPDNCDSPISDITVDNAAIADAVWDESHTDHIGNSSFGGLLELIFNHTGVDYKQIEKIFKAIIKKALEDLPIKDNADVLERIDKIVFPDFKEVIQAVESIKSAIPTSETFDDKNILDNIQKIGAQIKDIKMPEYPELDLSPVLEEIKNSQIDYGKFEEIKSSLNEANSSYKNYFDDLSKILGDIQSKFEQYNKLQSAEINGNFKLANERLGAVRKEIQGDLKDLLVLTRKVGKVPDSDWNTFEKKISDTDLKDVKIFTKRYE